jgi:alpha 1,2-mannosyltransferase
MSRAAHALVVAVIPDYLNVVKYQSRARGIVAVGGGAYMGPVLVSIRMLRRKNTILPVEVFLPNEKYYDTYICDEVLKELNARCVTLPRLKDFDLKKYQYKALAILLSSFEDVLFLDVDNFPLINPNELFDSAPYTTTGLVTWPDFWASSTSPLYYQISAQIPPSLRRHATTEAGQFLLSKRKHAATLLLATYYNLYGPKFYYRLLSQGAPGEGDKDTLIAAAADALDATYCQVRKRVMSIGYIGPYGYFTGTAMCQRHPSDDYAHYLAAPEEGYRESPDARIIFIHHSGVKLNPQDLLGQLDAGYRMWGSKEQTVGKFGFDLEAELWKEILVVACQGKHRKGWDEKRKVCDGLRGLWDAILEKEGRYANLGRAVA